MAMTTTEALHAQMLESLKRADADASQDKDDAERYLYINARPVSAAGAAMPDKTRRAIEFLGGSEAALLIQMRLSRTGIISLGRHRLLVPAFRVLSPGFLTAEEEAHLSATERMRVPMVEPDGHCGGTVSLKRWGSKKKKIIRERSSSGLYVLDHAWGALLQRNQIPREAVIQLWSFRVRSELWLALAVV